LPESSSGLIIQHELVKKLNQFMPIITLSKSMQLIWLLSLTHGLTLLVIWLLPLPWLWRGLFSLLLAASLLFYLLRDALKRLPNSVLAIKYLPDDKVELQNKNGEWLAGSIVSGSFVAPYLTTLAYRPDEKFFHRYLILLPDMLDAESFRELRTHLRWKNA
jgi:toxin CptA